VVVFGLDFFSVLVSGLDLLDPGACYGYFYYCHFQKKIQISCTGSKVPFWQFFNFSKIALLNPCMKFEFFLAKGILLKHYENGKKNIKNMSQIQDLCRKKYKKGIF
jgi:hypothetical protein